MHLHANAPVRRLPALRLRTLVIAGALLLSAVSIAPTPLAAQTRGSVPVMTLTTPAFPDGGLIPVRHAQPGRDVSPALAWSGAPDSVRSYVLLVHDVDATTGDGTDDVLHWLLWNIPGTATSLPEGIGAVPQRADGSRQISVSGPYYRGPAAPSVGAEHHYLFELYALDVVVNVPASGLSPQDTRAAVMAAMRGHVKAKGVLTGRFRRAVP